VCQAACVCSCEKQKDECVCVCVCVLKREKERGGALKHTGVRKHRQNQIFPQQDDRERGITPV